MKNPTLHLRLGILFALLAVSLGAFGAHGLKDLLTERGHVATWETAVRYQMWHALALILVFGLGKSRRHKQRPYIFTGNFFVVGICLFSGSLYGLSLVEAPWLGPITPLGGLCLLIGWGCLLFSKHETDPND